MFEDVSLTGKRWVPPEGGGQNIEEGIARLIRSRQLDIPVSTPIFPSMEQATERIFMAVKRQERVAIFGDYDCDGITATAQLVRFFRRNGIDPLVRLPHRIHDGYGLNTSIVEEFRNAGIELLITVDNGISAVQEIALAGKYGIETIVTDHHAVGADLPPATCVLHPELAECPLPHPSGAGVVFLLLEALEGGTWEERQRDLALAMFGTVADLVELRGYNRQLVQEGLLALREIKDGPLAILRECTDSYTSTDVAFRIAPRINAAGRMADPFLALIALLEGGSALEKLSELNSDRQQKTHNLYKEIRSTVHEGSPLLFAADTKYPHGLIGLIAGKLTEATGRPSCIATVTGEECTASLRSPPCYHVTEGLTRCADLLTRFGGHACAAGCTFPLHNLEELQKRLTSDIEQHVSAEGLKPSLKIDSCVLPEEITLDLCRALEVLEPYGSGNPEPRFLLEGVQPEDIRTVGADGTHMQCRIAGTKSIGFGLSSLLCDLQGPLDVLCRLQIDRWNGNMQPQIIMEDLRLTKRTLASV